MANAFSGMAYIDLPFYFLCIAHKNKQPVLHSLAQGRRTLVSAAWPARQKMRPLHTHFPK
jgi:hypothetical protein